MPSGIYYDNGVWDEYYCTGSETTWVSLCNDECPGGTVDSDGDGIFDECDDCMNWAGDVVSDGIIDILDIVITINIILSGGINSPDYTECELENANYNSDSIINILDVIMLINIVLSE